MKSIWTSFTSGDTVSEQDEVLRQRIALINQFHFITTLLLAGGAVNLCLLKDYPSAILLGAAALLLCFGFILNRHGYSTLAGSILTIVTNLVIFYFSSYFGPSPGIYFFFFPAAMCIAFLFDFNRQRALFVFHFAFLVLLVLILLFSGLTLFKGADFSQAYLQRVFAFDLVVSITLIVYFIYLVAKTNEQRQAELIRSVEDRKLAEERTRMALREKETLLAEVHHRVKNNLAVISGLLNLQMHSANNAYTRNILLDCKSRVASMALVHEKLYKSPSLAEIELHGYLLDLLKEIRNAFSDEEERVSVELEVPEVFMTVSEAIPCGLILNELVTNAYKHAFVPEQTDPRILIQVLKTGSRLEIKVSDNGKGMPLEIEPAKAETLGLILIQSLVDQLDGTFAFRNQKGTEFSLNFTPKRVQNEL
jgi:two-component sensor histidine kinase